MAYEEALPVWPPHPGVRLAPILPSPVVSCLQCDPSLYSTPLHGVTRRRVSGGEMQTAVDNPERAVIKGPVPPSSADTRRTPLPVAASPQARSAYLSLRKDCL